SSAGRMVGQFFPYMVKDIYGETVIPEDLGDISPTEWNGYPASMPADLLRRARAQTVVRDGIASFFFHPYLDASLLDETARGLLSLGYTFVRPCSLVGACSKITAKQPTAPRTHGAHRTRPGQIDPAAIVAPS